ncbi:MAG: hypothetical protein ACXWOV_02800 [Isosphaeraceae bacterium]
MNEPQLTEDVALELLRNWKPNEDLERLKLGDMKAPYEVGAELRMLRAGWPGDDIRKLLKVRATKLMKALNREMSREQMAHGRGQVVYDSPIRGA